MRELTLEQGKLAVWLTAIAGFSLIALYAFLVEIRIAALAFLGVAVFSAFGAFFTALKSDKEVSE